MKLRLLAPAVACLLFLSAGAASAGTMKYPATGAAYFTFDLPDDWKTKQPSGSTKPLYCVAGDGSGLNVQFYTVNNAELGDDLGAFAKAGLGAGGVQDIVVAKSGEDTVGDGLPAKFARSTFTREGKPYVSLMLGVPVSGDKTVVIHCFMAEDQLDGHKEAVQKLLGSIKPAK